MKIVTCRDGSKCCSWSSKEINARLTREYTKTARLNRVGDARYAVVDMGYPRLLWAVWDFAAKDFVRETAARTGYNPAVKYTKREAADRACAALNPRES